MQLASYPFHQCRKRVTNVVIDPSVVLMALLEKALGGVEQQGYPTSRQSPRPDKETSIQLYPTPSPLSPTSIAAAPAASQVGTPCEAGRNPTRFVTMDLDLDH